LITPENKRFLLTLHSRRFVHEKNSLENASQVASKIRLQLVRDSGNAHEQTMNQVFAVPET
jgi:hypothetical protein